MMKKSCMECKEKKWDKKLMGDDEKKSQGM